MIRILIFSLLTLSTIFADGEAGLFYKFDGSKTALVLKTSLRSTGEIVEVLPTQSINTRTRPLAPIRDSGYILWVDRNHRYGIAENIVLSGDGHYVFANWWLNNQRVSCYDVLGTGAPLWEYPGTFVWNRGQSMGISMNGNVLSALTQTTVYKWAKDSANPGWTFNYSGFTGMSTIVSEDGSVIASVGESGSDKKVYAFNGQTGESLWTASFTNSKSIQGLDISTNGRIVVVTTYDTCFVFENGIQRGNAILIGSPTSGTQYPAMISGDGSVLITGDYRGYLRKYNWDGSNYRLAWSYQYPPGTYYNWICGKAISKDGSKILVGVLDFGDGSNYTNSCAIFFESSSNVPKWFCHRYGDMVEATALSANGNYGVAGSWGMYNNTFGDVISVFNTRDSIPIFSVLDDIDEPGSIHTVDISNDGQYISAGGKAVHARQAGNGGEVYAIKIDITDIDENATSKPSVPIILNIRPNPFNKRVCIEFLLTDKKYPIEFKIYNASGQVVKSFQPVLPKPLYLIDWDGRDNNNRLLPDGVYILTLKSGNFVKNEKVCLIR